MDHRPASTATRHADDMHTAIYNTLGSEVFEHLQSIPHKTRLVLVAERGSVQHQQLPIPIHERREEEVRCIRYKIEEINTTIGL